MCIRVRVSSGKLSYGFGGANGDTGASADGLLALASATDPALQPTIDALLASVKAGAASYVSTGGASAAGKLAIVAAAYQLDPTSFGGVDLVAATKSAVAANGSVTPFASTFGSGLAVVGLQRSGSTPPATMTPWAVSYTHLDVYKRQVQGELELWLERFLGRPTPLTCAGRTDAGVHARGQVAHLLSLIHI